MRYTLDSGKTVNIPDKEIEMSMKNLELTKDEAIEMWLEDEGYLDNEEQRDIEKKVKARGVMRTETRAQAFDKRTKEKAVRERKPDPTKSELISGLVEHLELFAKNVQITKKDKLIEFDLGEEHFKLDLIRQNKALKAKKESK